MQRNLFLRLCNGSGICYTCVLSGRLLGAGIRYVSFCWYPLLTAFQFGYFVILTYLYS